MPAPRILFASLLLVLPSGARADNVPSELQYAFLIAFVPFAAVLVSLLAYLVASQAPWFHKAWTVLVFSFSTLLVVIFFLSLKSVHMPWYTVTLLWFVPASAAWLTAKWLAAHHGRKNASV